MNTEKEFFFFFILRKHKFKILIWIRGQKNGHVWHLNENSQNNIYIYRCTELFGGQEVFFFLPKEAHSCEMISLISSTPLREKSSVLFSYFNLRFFVFWYFALSTCNFCFNDSTWFTFWEKKKREKDQVRDLILVFIEG